MTNQEIIYQNYRILSRFLFMTKFFKTMKMGRRNLYFDENLD
jgi:hypothetical protein